MHVYEKPIASSEMNGKPDGVYAVIELNGESLKVTNKRIACEELSI